MKTLLMLWHDDAGAVISTEVVLVITILGLGSLVGLATLRNAVVQEMSDTAAAVQNIDQSYSYSGTAGLKSSTSGSVFNDQPDVGGPVNSASNGVQLNAPALGEGVR